VQRSMNAQPFSVVELFNQRQQSVGARHDSTRELGNWQCPRLVGCFPAAAPRVVVWVLAGPIAPNLDHRPEVFEVSWNARLAALGHPGADPLAAISQLYAVDSADLLRRFPTGVGLSGRSATGDGLPFQFAQRDHQLLRRIDHRFTSHPAASVSRYQACRRWPARVAAHPVLDSHSTDQRVDRARSARIGRRAAVGPRRLLLNPSTWWARRKEPAVIPTPRHLYGTANVLTLTTATVGGALSLGGPTAAMICITLAFAAPALAVLAATIVLVWHGLHGTDPGPAGRMLITLVRIVLRRPPTCQRRHIRSGERPRERPDRG